MAAVIDRRPHSFQFIREATGLRLTDRQFILLARRDRCRFKLVRFKKWDDEGAPIRPGRPGVGLRERPPV
jgi:hypothetical protein